MHAYSSRASNDCSAAVNLWPNRREPSMHVYIGIASIQMLTTTAKHNKQFTPHQHRPHLLYHLGPIRNVVICPSSVIMQWYELSSTSRVPLDSLWIVECTPSVNGRLTLFAWLDPIVYLVRPGRPESGTLVCESLVPFLLRPFTVLSTDYCLDGCDGRRRSIKFANSN